MFLFIMSTINKLNKGDNMFKISHKAPILTYTYLLQSTHMIFELEGDIFITLFKSYVYLSIKLIFYSKETIRKIASHPNNKLPYE